MAEDNKSLEQEYRKFLKEYCGQIPSLGNDNRIRPVSLEELYTPLRIRMGNPLDIEEIIQRIERLSGRTQKSTEDDGSNLSTTLETFQSLDRQLKERFLKEPQADLVDDESKLSDENKLSDKNNLSIVYARPGGGKTTWSKRVCLACLADDEVFLSEQLPLMKWHIEAGVFPLLFCCRNMAEINSTSINEFLSLSFNLIALSFGKLFLQNYSEQDFHKLLSRHALDGSLLLIVDGWDELADEEREAHFETLLKSFLETNPNVKCVITTRDQQKSSKFLDSADAYIIEALNTEDVDLFCKRWHEEMFRGDPQRIENYKRVINQLESPFFSRISYMTETPYLLSNLLRCSQHYGRLPSSIAELYEKTTDMMAEWFTKIDTGLEKHDVMIQLSYIACAMTKKRKLTLSKNELRELLGRCFYDLDGLFRRPLREKTVDQYLTEFLSRNCILETTFGGLYHFPHREMQDYFSAVAIVNGYLDAEDIMRNPNDILKDHYTAAEKSERTFWETVIVFSALISGSRFARSIVEDIIALTEEEEDNNNEFNYRDLLFLFVLNNTDILKSDRLHIYKVCFARQLSRNQINWIWQLAEQNEVTYAEFTCFIESEFKKSVENDDLLYCFAWAIIIAKQKADDGINPLHEAERYLIEGDKFAFATGLAMLDVFSWCKYETIFDNELSKYYCEKGFGITEEGCKALQSTLELCMYSGRDSFGVDVARTIYSCVLSDYLSDSRIKEVVTEVFLSDCLHRETMSADIQAVLDYLLAVYPVPALEKIHKSPQFGSEQSRLYYEYQFENDLKNNRRDSLAFSFNRCLVVGVWKTEDEVIQRLKKLNDITLDTVSRIRLTKIKKMLAIFSICFGTGETSKFEIYVQRDQLSDENDKYIDSLSTIDIVPDKYQVVIKNNIAYLVRRGELRFVRADNYGIHPGTVEELLEQGTREKEGFSLVNYALAISGFSKDRTGSYEVGLNYLQNRFSPPADIMRDIKQWWWRLAKERGELEGAIVLLWLFELGCIELSVEYNSEDEFSFDNMISLVSHFNEKIEKLGDHCKNTLHLLIESSKRE